MSIPSNRLLKNYRSINQFTENDQWSMNSINCMAYHYQLISSLKMTNDRWARLIGLPLSINQFTENDQWSMSSINRPTTTIDCTYTSTSIHCTVTIDFNTTGSVPSGPVLSVLPMVCLYRLKNCCLKMWQCKSLCKLLLLLLYLT